MKICEEKYCSGCGACSNICPKNAIEMIEADNGFLYPSINTAKCVECGLCQKTCPNNTETEFGASQSAYLFRNNNSAIRDNSSSGGAFSEIARIVSSKNGIVYGAEFNEKKAVWHNHYSDMADIQRFSTSKYVQSNTRDSYKQVYENLNSGVNVLFSGSPCQVAGLKSYLRTKNCDTSNLVTVDFICHGVGSPRFWEDCLDYYSKKYKSSIDSVNFRGKPRPGKLQNLMIKFSNGKRFIAPSTNLELFYYHFLRNYILRESCYECKYSKKERVSDITLADCFKAKNEHKHLIDGKGLSFLIANTEKGNDLLQQLSGFGEFAKVDINDYIQPNMSEPTPKPNTYDKFWDSYIRDGFHSALKVSGYKNIKNHIYKIAFILRLDDLAKKIKGK